MRKIDLQNSPIKDFHQYMLGSVVPRPIAWVSTKDKNGIKNLAPFSYFNAVSSVPPILMISIGRKPNGDKKDTLINIENLGEFVVNMIDYSLLHQMTLSSVAFDKNIDEFEMTGLDAIDSEIISAPRVKGAPIQFECKLKEIIEFGSDPGESSIVFGDVQCIHVDEKIIDENNRINPEKMDAIGRLGRAHYTRILPESILTVAQRQNSRPIGFQALPPSILGSKILSANDLSKLASLEFIPNKEQIEKLKGNLEGPIWENKSLLHQLILIALGKNELELAITLAFLS